MRLKKIGLKIQASGGLNPFGIVSAELARAIKDAFPGSTVDILGREGDGPGSLGTITSVNRGAADIGVTFPLAARWAVEERFKLPRGVFKDKLKNIRALACFAHQGWYPFAVRAEIDIRSIEDIREKRYPLRLLTTPRIHLEGDIPYDYSGAVVMQVLDAYDLSIEKLKAWGGTILGRTFAECQALKTGQADALFCEFPVYTPTMIDLAAECDLRFLPVNQNVMKCLHDLYGHHGTMIPKGFWRGVSEDVQTVGRFNLLLVVREDMPGEVSYVLAKLLKEVVSPRLPKHVMDGYLLTHTPDYVCTGTGVPLHPGAEKYYREVGLKPTLEPPTDPDYWKQRYLTQAGGL